MATVRNKSRYDKEMSAVTYNLKEQRVLEKSMQTLKLEQTYAMKLLELDNRIIKVHYKKLKERVSKIKSHLPPEDISRFRDLDQKGKLRPVIGGVSSSGAIKIAAASRRLNLGSGLEERRPRRCIKSAIPRISVSAEQTEIILGSNSESTDSAPEIGKLQRSNSVTGVFIDAPEREKTLRPGSASILLQTVTDPPTRPGTAVDSTKIDDQLNIRSEYGIKHRPTTSVRYKQESQDDFVNGDVWRVRPSTTPYNHHPHHHQTHSPFSSHMTAEKEARTNGLPISSRSDRGRRSSFVSNDSIDSNLGDNLFEERRQELLEEENVRAATLDKRTQLFLKDVDDYLQKNPPLQPSHVAFENALREIPRRDSLQHPFGEKEATGPHASRHLLRRRNNDRSMGPDDAPTFSPENEYKEKLLTLWKDLNKCRYLRMPDERIDLSGVNTLVKDQMKLFETLRNAESSPITDREVQSHKPKTITEDQ